MQRVFRSAISITEQLCIPKRHFSITTNLSQSAYPLRYAQNYDIGHQVFRAFAVDVLMDQYPNLSAGEINDVASGLTYDSSKFCKLKASDLIDTSSTSHDIIAKLGELKRKNEDLLVEGLLEEFKNTCLSSLSPEDTSNLIKSQHPKFLLRRFCNGAKINLKVTVTDENGHYMVSVFFGEELVATARHEFQIQAEHLACLSTIKMRFLDQFYDANLDEMDEISLESDVDIGKGHLQRTVEVKRSAGESFGFTIRGGQQKMIKNEEYMQLNIITPILVTNVAEGSPVEAAGLQRGDIILAVNDHSLTNKTHEQAVNALKRFEDAEEVEFIVHYNKHELLKYEAEQKLVAREYVRVKEELKSKNYKRWHETKAQIDPMDYFLSQFKDKKRKFQAKNSRKALRLWDDY